MTRAMALPLMLVLAGAASASATPGDPEPGMRVVQTGRARLTVDAQAAPFAELLRELGRTMRITVAVDPGPDAATPITATFNDVPVEDALRRLLRGRNFTIEYGAAGIDEVHVYQEGAVSRTSGAWRADPPSRARSYARLARAAAEEQEDLNTLERTALDAAEPDERMGALSTISALDNTRARDIAIALLTRDDDEEVLSTAVRILRQQEPVPLEPLLSVALSGKPVRVRIEALQAASADGRTDRRLLGALKSLMSDQDEEVRETAKQLLDDLSQ